MVCWNLLSADRAHEVLDDLYHKRTKAVPILFFDLPAVAHMRFTELVIDTHHQLPWQRVLLGEIAVITQEPPQILVLVAEEVVGGTLNEVIRLFSHESPMINSVPGTNRQVVLEACVDHPRGQARKLVLLPERNEPQV